MGSSDRQMGICLFDLRFTLWFMCPKHEGCSHASFLQATSPALIAMDFFWRGLWWQFCTAVISGNTSLSSAQKRIDLTVYPTDPGSRTATQDANFGAVFKVNQREATQNFGGVPLCFCLTTSRYYPSFGKRTLQTAWIMAVTLSECSPNCQAQWLWQKEVGPCQTQAPPNTKDF